MDLSKIRKDEKDCIPVVLASDGNYAKYLATTIQSIIVNISDTNQYEIIVFDGGISEEDKQKITGMIHEIKNVIIRFVLVEEKIKNIDFSQFKMPRRYITHVTYFQLFIPRILSMYKKCVYLDCDLVVNCDIAELYKQELDECCLAAVLDYGMNKSVLAKDPDRCEYVFETLKLKDSNSYFNSGVLVMNLEQMRHNRFEERALRMLNPDKLLLHNDQSILNAVCNGSVKYLNYSYNFHWCFGKNMKSTFPKEMQPFFDQPKIIHYIGALKPWTYKTNSLADYFWKYARQTPFFDEIKKEYEPYLKKHQKENLKNYRKYRWKSVLALDLNKRWRTKRDRYFQLCHY